MKRWSIFVILAGEFITLFRRLPILRLISGSKATSLSLAFTFIDVKELIVCFFALNVDLYLFH